MFLPLKLLSLKKTFQMNREFWKGKEIFEKKVKLFLKGFRRYDFNLKYFFKKSSKDLLNGEISKKIFYEDLHEIFFVRRSSLILFGRSLENFKKKIFYILKSYLLNLFKIFSKNIFKKFLFSYKSLGTKILALGLRY